LPDRDSVDFEVSVRRFGVWQAGVWAVAASALGAVAAWVISTWDAQSADGALLDGGLALFLGLATVGVAASLVRIPGGRLACHAGAWTFAPDQGAVRSGNVEVALDLGSFLLLRLRGDARRRSLWLPVQRRGLEREWHALRCAVYSPQIDPASVQARPTVE